MGVGVKRDGDGGVSEALGDYLGMDAGLQRQRGVRVAQVVQADAWQQRSLHRLAEVARHRLRVEGGAVLGGEDKTRLDPGLVPVVLLPLQPLPHPQGHARAPGTALRSLSR
jgi:hypothetical protein